MGASREHELAELGLAFRALFRTLGRVRGRDTHLAGSELSHAQFELLAELADRGPLPAGELAAAARMSPGTVTQMLEGLAASGHVKRERSGDDRRVVVSRLTEQGRARIEDKRAAWKERWERALADVPAAELRAARRVLERLEAMLDEAPPARAGEDPRRGARGSAHKASGPAGNASELKRAPAIVDDASRVHAGA